MEAGPKRKFSPTWEYFDMISPTKVKCRICDKEVGYNNNTSSMIRHYRSFHEPGDRSSNDSRKQLLDEALVDMVIKDSIKVYGGRKVYKCRVEAEEKVSK
ncbi:hypothetical protein OJAV_G00096300 [Oryzias javanicus]|uniref:BED-type domain-containing protein n=1 Tax=Oryzias javanicus TaxID=123683 RepID=A0A437D256_ORYJA|nr:hypothetical protein OJAV_G00096300 [Oryzias javanicus]